MVINTSPALQGLHAACPLLELLAACQTPVLQHVLHATAAAVKNMKEQEYQVQNEVVCAVHIGKAVSPCC